MFVRLQKHIFNWIVFAALLAVTIGWLVSAGKWRKRIDDYVAPGIHNEVAAIVKELESENPKAAAELSKLRDDREIRMGVDAAILHAKYRGGLAAVQGLANSKASSNRLPYQMQLANLAADRNRLRTPQDREEFLLAHGTSLELLAADPAAQQEYFGYLDQASEEDRIWRSAKSDSMAMLVCSVLRESESAPARFAQLLAYYEREKDWVDELLLDVMAVSEASDVNEARQLIPDIVGIASDHHPRFKTAAKDDQLGAVAFFLFLEYGDLISRTALRGVPLQEMLDVVFANGDFLEEYWKGKSAAEQAERLVHIRNQKPSVWQGARVSALALRLNEDVPQHADELLETFGTDDLVALLYASYEHEVEYAADCVVKFGDLAIYILNEYCESNVFRTALTRSDVGPRIIPYTAKFGDSGLDRWEENKAWLDRYFQRDGTPIDPEWWTSLPGGAAAHVARNFVKGVPSEWSELGWAALDVADAALLVASFGTSSAVTTGSKTVSGKVVRQKVARDAAKQQAVRAARRQAGTEFAKKGGRQAAKTRATPLLRHAVANKTGWVSQSKRVWRAVGQTVAEPIRKAQLMTLTAAQKLRNAWGSVPVGTRRTVYRSLLAVGLFVTISQRTVPAMNQIGKAAGDFVADIIESTISGTQAGIAAALEKLLGASHDRTVPWVVGWATYLGVIPLLFYLLWRFSPIRNARLRYVR